MEYRVLGPLEVRDGEGSLPLAGAKQRALLALLLVHANHVLSRDRLIDELWGDATARDGGAEPAGVRLAAAQAAAAGDAADTAARLPARGRAGRARPAAASSACSPRGARRSPQGDPERASRVLHDALALWRGPALAEFAFEPFAQAEIGRLEDLRLAAVEERIEADLALGRHADLIGELEALIAENPYRERLRGQLMLALYRSGRQAEALDAYQDARRALVDELGIEPSDALQRLEKAILTHDESLDTPRVPRPAAARRAAARGRTQARHRPLRRPGDDRRARGGSRARRRVPRPRSTARRRRRSKPPAAPSKKGSPARCSPPSARRTHARRITPSARSAPRSPRATG